MKQDLTHDEKIANMIFGSVYPHYVNKVVKKGRTQDELDQVISWLTGFDKKQVDKFIEKKLSFAQFFDLASLPPNAHLIKGVICGYRVEDIENPLTQKVRYLDKIIDELAKGRAIEKIINR